MASSTPRTAHAICVPSPFQGHITPMLNLAKLFHSRGFHITFVNTQFNHQRLIESGAIDPVAEIDGFMFETVDYGIPSSDANAAQNANELVKYIYRCGLAPLRELILRLNSAIRGGPPISCMFRDVLMSCAQPLGDELGIPDVVLWTMAGPGFMGYLHIDELIQRGYIPFKDASYFSNGYLDTGIDWIPSMPGISLKDLPSCIRKVDPNDIMLNFYIEAGQASLKASALIIDTFEELDQKILDAARHKFKLRKLYSIGPLFSLCGQIPNTKLNSIRSNLWTEETSCIDWLNKRSEGSVIYVNFGSIVVLTPEQLREFAWGLADSKHSFMWVSRPDLVSHELVVFEQVFMEEMKERGVLVGWCPQKQVLAHPSVGGYLTHCGWNSILESIYSGVPMLCWPLFADQLMNCRFACDVWGIGIEIENDVKRDKLEGAIKELMKEERGKEVKKNVMKWKEYARKATEVGGSAYNNFDKLVNDVLVMKH